MKIAIRVLITSCGACALAVSCSRDPAARSRKYMESGDKFAKAAKYNEAAIEYRNAIQATPDAPEAHAKLADVAARANDVNTAATELLRVAELEPSNASAQVRAASIYLLAGRFADARTKAEAALRDDPGAAPAHIVLGQALAALHDTSASKASFEAAVAAAPQSPDAHVGYGSYLWSEQRTREAEAEFRHALALGPNGAAPNRAMALLCMATGRTAEAEGYWKAVAAAPGGDPFAVADYDVATNRLDAAEAELRRLLGAADTRDGAAIRLAPVQHARGDAGGAFATLDALLARKPRQANVLLLRAQLLAADRRLDEALATAQDAALADPTSPQAALLTGQIQDARGEADRAVQSFESAAALNRSDPTPYLAIASVRLKQQRPDDAVAAVERARTRRPNDPSIDVMLVETLRAAGQTSRASEEANRAIVRTPRVAALHVALGRAEAAAGHSAEARHAFGEALRLDASSTDALSGLAALDLQDKRGADAIARVTRRLQQKPNDPALLMLASQVDAAAGDTTAAEAALRRLVTTDPGNLQAFAALGALYVRLNRLDAARDQFAKIADEAPTAGPATMVGMILEAQHHSDQAQRQYERALAKFPHAGVAANNLAWMYLDAGRLDDALRWALVAKDELHRTPEATDTLGWVYCRRNQPEQAIPLLAETVSLRPDNPVYHYHLGIAYSKAGSTRSAREELQRALDSGTAFADHDEAQRIVQEIDRTTSK